MKGDKILWEQEEEFKFYYLLRKGVRKMCCKILKEGIKRLNCCDVSCAKLAVMLFTVVLIKGIKIIWDIDLLNLMSVWWWLVLAIIFTIKPAYKILKKGDAGINQ